MKIVIDADSCPVINLIEKIARKEGLDVLIVKNLDHNIVSGYSKVVTVDKGSDMADFYIVNNVDKGDIVVTQDYGLAAMVLAKKSYPITPNGRVIDENNIENILEVRHFNKIQKTKHRRYVKHKKRSNSMDEDFANNLILLIQKYKTG